MAKQPILITFFLLAILISACQGENPQSTTDPNQLETQVANLVSEQLTQIAIEQPTSTLPPTPTETPTLEVLLTETPIVVTSTPEAASPTPQPPLPTHTSLPPTATSKPLPTATTPAFACQLTKQKPENGKTFKPGDDFDAVWTVKNIGTVSWNDSEFDYKYDSGDKIHQNEIYDLPTTVKPGESVELPVDMKAPDKEGTYKTTWVLHQGKAFSCKLTLEIKVEK